MGADSKLKVFSMFTGIGGFEVGMHNSSLEHELIGYSEIDKYATQIFEKQISKGAIKNYGDATNIVGTELPDFQLLVGGFPCQAFSVAGRQEGFADTTRGTLFFDIARICAEKRPKYLVLENVRGLLSHDGGKTFAVILGVLSDLGYAVEWQVLNSKDYGVPQNRQRIFIVGYLGGFPRRALFSNGGDDTKDDRSIIEEDITGAITATYAKGVSTNEVVRSKGQRRQLVGIANIRNSLMRIDRKGNIKKDPETAATLCGGAHSGGNHSDMDWIVQSVLTPGRTNKSQNGRVIKEENEPSFTLTSREVPGVRIIDPSHKNEGLREYKEYSPTLNSRDHKEPRLVDQGNDMRIRRLTPIECERLQGFPDGWTEGLSNTQRYKTLGNAVTTNVITAIMNGLDAVIADSYSGQTRKETQ